MSKIDYNVLREAAEAAKGKTTWQDLQAFHAAATPEVVLAMLDVLDASLEAEPVMFCISGQNVDSEEHVSTSKAVVDAWVEEWNQVDGSPVEPLYKTMPLYCHAAPPAPVVPEADPVAWTDEEELRDVKQYGLGEIFQYPPDKYTDSRRVIPLYRVPPAPEVPEEMYWQDAPVEGSSKAAAYATGWNACRAAMLQGKGK
ncbi:Eaa protein [Escherichia coli]|uniref:ead/Ea22-like family protein n=1 Tax=Escherichia coli TaxID=562 RepID=UPI0019CC70A2|nr:Eaa protein [Escherichia coli]